MIYLLHDHGALVNAVDFEGLSPLHYASVKGNAVAVQLLMSCDGCNVNVSVVKFVAIFFCK